MISSLACAATSTGRSPLILVKRRGMGMPYLLDVPATPVMTPFFNDRNAAGRQLAGLLQAYAGRPDVVVLALPRGGVPVAREVARSLRAPLDLLIAADGLELIRLQALYRGLRPAVPVAGRTVIVVDDGIATGNSMRNALTALRAASPEWIVVAVPVAPPEAQERIGTAADEFACLECSPHFDLVGQCYRDFAVPGDEEIRRALA
jgi:putative phosphoribosyl transferase